MIYSYTTLNTHYKNSLKLERLHHAGEAWGICFPWITITSNFILRIRNLTCMHVCVCLCLLRYLCVNYVALDLLLCDRDVLQNHLQSHRHHAGHPVNQTGADVTWHPPLEQNKVSFLSHRHIFSCILWLFRLHPLFKLLKYTTFLSLYLWLFLLTSNDRAAEFFILYF